MKLFVPEKTVSSGGKASFSAGRNGKRPVNKKIGHDMPMPLPQEKIKKNVRFVWYIPRKLYPCTRFRKGTMPK